MSPQNYMRRNWTPYTAMYNGTISYGAKIGDIQVFAEQHAGANGAALYNLGDEHLCLVTVARVGLAMLHADNQLLSNALQAKHENTTHHFLPMANQCSGKFRFSLYG